MIGYKLFRILKDGSLTPLFINKTSRLPLYKKLEAEDHPTKGFAHRPGWHCTAEPFAPHIKDKPDRVWYKVLMEDFEELPRPERYGYGGMWYLANYITILEKA